MRRFLGILVGASFLAGCSDVTDSLVPESSGELDPFTQGISADIFDGTSGAEGANPHFFFLSPLVPEPDYFGIADDSLEPVVVICPEVFWDTAAESCSDPLAVFSMDALDSGDLISLNHGVGYSVVWKTKSYPAPEGQIFRISVSVFDQILGWVDVRSYDQQSYNSFQHTDPDGYVAISSNGSANIAFRIEDGALESEFCDASNIEDCDVEVFAFDEEGCLRVFNDPGASGEALGTQACVPPFAAEMGGQPLEDDFLVIMTLEKPGAFQGGAQDPSWQIPFFPDLRTVPDGISFNQNSEGVRVTICQAPEAVADGLHQFLRPFLIFSDGSTALPEEYYFEIGGDCEAFMDEHAEVAASNQGGRPGLLGRLAGGLSKASKFFLPEPLRARRRLHGGLNTVVWEISGDDGGGEEGDNVAGPAGAPGISFTDPEPTVLEMGALLDVDPFNSTAIVPESSVVNSEITIIIQALDYGRDPFPFEVPVTVQAVSGSDTPTVSLVYDEISNSYTATYTPTTVGDDAVTITVDGGEVNGSPFSIEIRPVGPSAPLSSFSVSPSEAGSPTTVTVTVLDEAGQPYVDGGAYDIDVVVDVLDPVSGESVLDEPIQAEDDDGQGSYDGDYDASWIPGSYGDFTVTVTIGGETVGTPSTITTAPWPVDPAQSSASVADGEVESETTISVTLVNTNGGAYDYGAIRPVQVEVVVTGANTATRSATDSDGDGVYEASYTPLNAGTDHVQVSVEEAGVLGKTVIGTYTSEVAPLSGDLVVVVEITGGAPADGLPVYLYDGTGTTPAFTATTDPSGSATFVDIDFGDYTVHLPKRDFDVQFTTMTRAITHDQAPNRVTFAGTTLAMPATASVWRIRADGSGNAFQYVPSGRSWTSAQNQLRDDVLHGAQGHLATATSPEENAFVAAFFATDPALCPDDTSTKKCRVRGWLGLTDEAVEGHFEWVTGEEAGWFSWPDGNTASDQPLDRKGNRDHVEIGPDGLWGIINGASSTNDGYFVEWEVEWPVTPPF